MRPFRQTVHQADMGQFCYRNTLQRIGLPLAGILVGGGAIVCLVRPVQAAELTGWRFDPATRQLEVSVPQGTTPRYFLLAQPARIVLDLPNTQMGAVPVAQTYAGAVRQIRVAQFDPGLTRIVIELSADAVLAPGQVELQPTQTGGSNAAQAQWRLRPLLVGDTASPNITSSDITPSDITSRPEASAPPSPASERSQAVAVAPQPAASPAPAASLPPLEPNAVQIPVEASPLASSGRSTQATALPPASPSLPVQPSVSVPPLETATPTSEPVEAIAPPAVSAPVAALPANSTSASLETPLENSDRQTPPSATIVAAEPQPIILPPALLPNSQPVTVRVPPLQSPASSSPPAPPAQSAAPPSTPAPTAARPSVEFGQPWSSARTSSARTRVEAANLPLMLASGSVLRLRYPQQTSLQLRSGVPHQEVLLLQEAIRDRSGNILIPQDSQVLGRFETDSNGSQFVAQAITLQGHNIRLNAKSDVLEGDRQPSERNLIGGSALGALAVGVASGFTGIGLLGGALAGAATTFLTAPQPATIQPNQVIEVRLLEDLARSS